MIDQSVEDVMTNSVRTITRATTASTVARLFATDDIGSALVVDSETGELVGIVTESDIMRQVATDADITVVSVDSFMTTPVITTSSTESIHTAATLMKDHSIRRLPVVDDGNLVGILTTTNLVHYLPHLRTRILRGRNELSGQ
jgi:CBS domain-containing protein